MDQSETTTIQNEDYWAPNGVEQYQQAFNERSSMDGQVIASVFTGSRTFSGQHTLMPSPPKKDMKLAPQYPNRPQLDIELIEESNDLYHQSL